jgi:hypothetical protein
LRSTVFGDGKVFIRQSLDILAVLVLHDYCLDNELRAHGQGERFVGVLLLRFFLLSLLPVGNGNGTQEAQEAQDEYGSFHI